MSRMTKGKAAVLLIVEDDREMRSLLCDEFCGTGYQLREARDGDEAFLAVLQSVPDLILTDLRMPAGGDDYISRLRTVAPRCPIVVIRDILSGPHPVLRKLLDWITGKGHAMRRVTAVGLIP